MPESEPSGAPSQPGRQPIEGYELIRKLGEGGMGAVYLARQLSMDREVALKILRRSLARNSSFVERFVREARLAGRLDHENIVRALDVGQSGDYHFLAMEYVEGRNLSVVLREKGQLEEREALEVTLQVARALEYAHSREVIHRDVKPENVLLTPEGTAKLTDMGLAKQTGAESHLTQTGSMVGTPHYVSPEQARGDPDVDIRGDIYSLGATLYRLVTGQTPFQGSTAAVVMTKHLTEEPAPPREINANVSLSTSRVIYKAMAKNRESRYQVPSEMISDIKAVLAGRMPRIAMARPKVGGTAETRPVSKVYRRGRRGTTGGQQAVEGRRLPLPLPAMIGIAAGVLLAAGLGIWALTRGGEEEVPPPPPPVDRPEQPPEEPPPEEPLVAEKNFEEMFNYAAGFWKDNPEAYEEAVAKFKIVKRDAGGTVWSMKADDQIKLVEKARTAAAEKVLAGLKEKAAALAASGDYDGAMALWKQPPEKLAELLAAGFAEERGKLKKDAEGKIGAALAAAEKHSKDGRPSEGLAELEEAAGVKYAALASKIAALRARLEKEKQNEAALAGKRRAAEAREALGGILDRFDELVAAGDAAGAKKHVAAERAKLGAEKAKLVAAELDAAAKIAALLVAHEKARADALAELKGKEIEITRNDGTRLKGEVVSVTEGVIKLKVAFRIGGTTGYSERSVKISDVSPADRARLLPALKTNDANGRIAAALVALGTKDLAAAEKHLAGAGEHPFAARYRDKLDELKLGAVEAAAKRAWTASVDVREKYDLPGAKKLLAALDAFLAAHGKTECAAGLKDEIARLRGLAEAAIEASPEGVVARIRRLYHGTVKSFDPKTLTIEIFYDFSSPDQLRDWEASTFAAGNLKGAPLDLGQEKLHLNKSGRCALLKGLFRSMSISADFIVHAGDGNCTLLVCADDRGNWYNMFGVQQGGDCYIERYIAGKWKGLGPTPKSPFAAAKKGSMSLSFADGKLTGRVGSVILNAEDQTYPYGRVGMWAYNTHVSYDNVTVRGVLDKEWLEEQLKVLAARSVPRVDYSGRWQQLSFRGETPRGRSNDYRCLIYDSKRKRCVLFGGHHTNWNDLWALDLGRMQWTCLQKNQEEGGGVGTTRPKGRTHPLMVYDEGNDLYWLNEDWLYEPATGRWRKNEVPLTGVKSPPYGPWLRPGLACDPDGKRMLWWKGKGAWVYLGKAEAKQIPDGPPHRSYIDGGLVYDRKEKVFVLFGGAIHAKGVLGDTWTFDPTASKWHKVNSEANPSPRYSHRLHFSDKLGVVVMIGGGTGEKTSANDVWVLETAAERWVEVKTTEGPKSYVGATSYDRALETGVLFTTRGQTWTLKITATPERR